MKADLTNIKNIIFDLGNVLLNLHFEETVDAFRKIGLKGEVVDYRQSYAAPAFYKLEVGEITVEEFRIKVREFLNNPGATDQQIDDAWYKIIGEIPAHRVKAVQDLSKKYNVYLFSNTNKIHIDRLLPDFKKQHGIDFPSLFVKDFYSHEIHERKPDISAFQKVIELSGVEPSETLFVDDLEKNCLGAEKAGLKSFWLKEGMEMSEVFAT